MTSMTSMTKSCQAGFDTASLGIQKKSKKKFEEAKIGRIIFLYPLKDWFNRFFFTMIPRFFSVVSNKGCKKNSTLTSTINVQ